MNASMTPPGDPAPPGDTPETLAGAPSEDRAEILLDTPALLLRAVRHPSPVCVVTFSHWTPHPAEQRLGFGEAVLDAGGIDAIHVVSRANDWFQNPEMHRAVAAIRGALGGKPCVTYGSSMGAYGAIRFAGMIGAAQAFALSPQYALDRRVVPFERRWEPYGSLPFLPWQEVEDPPPAIVLFDPYNPDRQHVALWAAERPVIPVALPLASHPVTTMLAELGLLLPALREVVAGRFEPAALVRAFRVRRHGSAEYVASLSEAQPPRRAAWKIGLMRRAVGMAPERSHLRSRLAMLLYRAGRFAEAEEAHRRALALDPEDALLAFRYSRFLQRLGRFEAALPGARLAAARQPDLPGYARHLRQVERMAGGPGPARFLLSILPRVGNVAVRRLDRAFWGRRPSPFGRLANP